MREFLLGSIALAAVLGGGLAAAQTGQPAPAASQQPGHVAGKGMAHHSPHNRADVQRMVSEHFARLDANRDGFVTKAETEAARSARRHDRGERKMQRREHRFEQLDTNNDGQISRPEFDSAHAKRDARQGDRSDRRGKGMRGMHRMGVLGARMFEMADGDRDGRVSLAEANAAALRHFDQADANRDGTLTADERRQMHRQWRAER